MASKDVLSTTPAVLAGFFNSFLVNIMTTGLVNDGGTYTVGPFNLTSWSGDDRQRTDSPKVSRPKFRDLPPIVDAWGRSLTPRDGLEYEVARLAAKGRLARMNKLKAAVYHNRNDEHAYQKTVWRGMNPTIYENGSPTTYRAALGDFNPVSPWTSNDTLGLILKLREKILGSQLDAGLALAEIDKAFKQIGGNFNVLTKSLQMFPRHPGKALRYLLTSGESGVPTASNNYLSKVGRTGGFNDVANWQLAWEFGYRPLISDTDDLMQFVAWRTANKPPVKVRAKKRIVGPDVVSDAGVPADPNQSFNYATGRLICYLDDVNLPLLTGVADIPAILYERTPWSFMVDWVVPIGSYLQALNYKRSVDGFYVLSIKHDSAYVPGVDHFVMPNGVTYSGLDLYFSRRVRFTRSLGLDLNIPYPGLKPWAKTASAQHCIDACSLFTQKVSTFLYGEDARNAWAARKEQIESVTRTPRGWKSGIKSLYS